MLRGEPGAAKPQEAAGAKLRPVIALQDVTGPLRSLISEIVAATRRALSCR